MRLTFAHRFLSAARVACSRRASRIQTRSWVLVAAVASVTPWSPRHQAGDGWREMRAPPPAGMRFEDISIATSGIGFVVSGGSVLRRERAGGDWHALDVDARWMRSVALAPRGRVWIGTLDPDAVLFESDDLGESWKDVSSRISGARPKGLCALWAVSDSIVYGVGRYDGPAYLIRTVDAGRTWMSHDLTSQAGRLVDVYFNDARSGLIVGGTARGPASRVVVLGTADSGKTWSIRHQGTDPGEWAWKISFPTRQVGYVSVQSAARGKLLKTVDGGVHWEELIVPGAPSLQAVGFLTSEVGWVSGPRGTWRTTDGGATWSKAGAKQYLNRIIVRDSNAYGVGDRIYRSRHASVFGAPRG